MVFVSLATGEIQSTCMREVAWIQDQGTPSQTLWKVNCERLRLQYSGYCEWVSRSHRKQTQLDGKIGFYFPLCTFFLTSIKVLPCQVSEIQKGRFSASMLYTGERR